ncbi:unnamed protein product [Phyllotreta striolata]|uniref:Protein inscuteable homologue C-terminal domain-containing protein n=1 Tax=Phyllotreta striolata TaxID=444603 RepID=A0A9N9TV52_PHYSR|nr:unnamed protein product [Phyllotreta striolata]
MTAAFKMPSEFKRSPSKVWWGNDTEWREISTSPGSQDSGFSDTETSPHQRPDAAAAPAAPPAIPRDIFKELASERAKRNFSANFREKSTPEKQNLHGARPAKPSPRASRNLFGPGAAANPCTDRYSARVRDAGAHLNGPRGADGPSVGPGTRSLAALSDGACSEEISKSAPAVLVGRPAAEHEATTSFIDGSFEGSLSSDCDSELESLFAGRLESPRHTSTPKADGTRQIDEKLSLKFGLDYQQDRVPPIPTEGYTDLDNKAVEMWMKEARRSYEQECMTTLQCKSIVGELNRKVLQLAACATTIFRGVVSHARCIEMEYNYLNNSDAKTVQPLVQSLTGNIAEFLGAHGGPLGAEALRSCEQIRSAASADEALRLVPGLFARWQEARDRALADEIKKLVNKLECPASELDLRATVTGVTSMALRHQEAVELLAKADAVPVLLILCEKCEGSSMRSLLLRALTTVCSGSSAVRQFEKFSGVQIVADILEEHSRPEPERSEAVALLAQITAPWLEDNHSVKGLQEYSSKLVRALTRFASSTRCCQNLLLCAAALANLSSMDSKSARCMVEWGTAEALLGSVEARGPAASVYLLEQMAALLANLSALDVARKQLTEIRAPGALLCFLRMNFATDFGSEDVVKRLQQKSIIALSRLCGEKEAARQVVELGGVEKLVKMCREKDERFDSDAVLVAALATLRKIVDACGSDVLSAQDAQELVEPKLLDSFLAYSSQNESYV